MHNKENKFILFNNTFQVNQFIISWYTKTTREIGPKNTAKTYGKLHGSHLFGFVFILHVNFTGKISRNRSDFTFFWFHVLFCVQSFIQPQPRMQAGKCKQLFLLGKLFLKICRINNLLQFLLEFAVYISNLIDFIKKFRC